jgi:hypothetical protein
MRALVILASVALCTPAIAQQQPPAATSPQSQCAELGEKIMEENDIGMALSQVSRYDPRTNRCYVELIVLTADPTKSKGIFHRYLFDGQTKELLASASRDNDRPMGGQVFDKQHRPASSTNNWYDDTNEYIDKMMAEDRK